MRQVLVNVELIVNIPAEAEDADEAMMPLVAEAIDQLAWADRENPGVAEWQITSAYEIDPETGQALDDEEE